MIRDELEAFDRQRHGKVYKFKIELWRRWHSWRKPKQDKQDLFTDGIQDMQQAEADLESWMKQK
jgi:hypothetical protein